MGRLLGTGHPARWIVLVSGALALAHWFGLLVAARTLESQSLSLRAIVLASALSVAWLCAGLILTDRPDRGRALLTRALGHPRAPVAVFGGLAAVWIVVALVMIPWNDERSNIDAARYLASSGIESYLRNLATVNDWLGPHHPPFLPLVYGAIFGAFGFHLAAGRIFAVACSLATAVVAYRWIAARHGRPLALATLAMTPTLPVVAFAGTAAILDAPFWLLFTLALVAFDRFLQTGARRDALVVGIWTAIACMARYNAVLLPPVYLAIVAIVPAYRPFLRRASTWIVVFTPALLVLPWIAYSAATGTLAVQATRIASFVLTAFIPEGGAFYLRQYIAPLVPFMVGLFNAPLWINGAIRSWRDPDVAPARVVVVAACAYATLLAVTLPNPRYLLAVGALLAFLAAREVLDIEEREGRGAHALVYVLGWAALHVAVVLQQTSAGFVYLFY